MADNTPIAADVPRESPDVYPGELTEHDILYDGEDKIAVILPRERAEGVVRVGTMEPGKSYFVRPEEALRLVRVKHFQYSTPADAERADAFAQPAAAAPAAISEPAPAASVPSPGGGPRDGARRRKGTTTRDED